MTMINASTLELLVFSAVGSAATASRGDFL